MTVAQEDMLYVLDVYVHSVPTTQIFTVRDYIIWNFDASDYIN